MLTSAVNPRPYILPPVNQSGTNLVINGTNGFANRPYYVLASTNVALPLANWTSIATNIFGANGHFSFTAPVDPAKPERFFLLQVP